MRNHFSFATLFAFMEKKNCMFLPCYSCWHHFPALNFKKVVSTPHGDQQLCNLVNEYVYSGGRCDEVNIVFVYLSIIVILILLLFPCAHVCLYLSVGPELKQGRWVSFTSHFMLQHMYDKHWNHVRRKASIPHHTWIDFIANKQARLSDSSSSVISNAIHTLSQIILHNRLLTKRFGYTLRLSNNMTIYILY